MVNLSTSQFPYAYALDGSELIGVVQNNNNVKALLSTVNGLIDNKPTVQLGYRSYAEAGYSVAVGAFSLCFDRSVAVGYYAYAVSTDTVAIGKYALTPAAYGIAIGSGASTNGNRGISIGRDAEARQNLSVAIGNASYTIGGEACVSLGSYAFTQGYNNIALGTNARVQNNNNQIAIGYGAYSNCYSSIAIGNNAVVEGSESGRYNIAIGTNARASYLYNVAIGYRANYQTFSYVGKSTVVGHQSAAIDWYATVIGYDSRAGSYAVAVGTYNYAYSYSVAIGNYCLAIGRHAISMGNSGAFGNYSIALGGCFAGHSYSTVIGSNVGSMVIGDFTMRGVGEYFVSMNPTDRQQRFIGHTASDNQTVALTADGNAPSSSPSNLPAIPQGTMARMTATVIGHGGNVISFDPSQVENYDSASFVMSPALIIRYGDATYDLLGNAPTFTLENSTGGASGWAAPVLNVVNLNELHITVTNSATVVDWIALVKFEAGS